MARSALQWLSGVLLLASAANALKFDLPAHSGSESQKKERCIRNFVGQETLVVVTATVDGTKGDGMAVNMHVRCRKYEVEETNMAEEALLTFGANRSAMHWATSTVALEILSASRELLSSHTLTSHLTSASRTCLADVG